MSAPPEQREVKQMKVKEIMVQPVTVIGEDTALAEIARLLLEQRIGCVPVVDAQGRLKGIITESDFTAKERGVPFSTFRAPQLFGQWVTPRGIEKIYDAARALTAREIMSAPVITVTEDDAVETVVTLMLRHDINRIPVARDGVPVGIVARHDLLRLMTWKKEQP
jgi:CBS domain-containing protein